MLPAVFIAALFIVSPVPAADTQAPFAFAEETPLVVTCSQLVDGVEIVVRNQMATVQQLNKTVGRLTDESGKQLQAGSVCGGLSVDVIEPTAEAGASTAPMVDGGGDAVLRLSAKATPTNKKTYSSTLAVYSEAGVVARRELTITQDATQASKATGDAAVPLVASRDVEHQHRDPFDDWVVWLPVDLPESQSAALVAGETVGVLAGARGTAPVTYGEETQKRLTSTTSLVPLHVRQVPAGTYSGKVDLTPDDSKTGEVSLSLTVRDWWPLAVGALLVGILIAVLVQWQNGYRVTRARLLARVGATSAMLSEARGRLLDAAKVGQPDNKLASWGRFDVGNLAALQNDLRNEIGRRTRLKGVAIDQKIVDDLDTKITSLENQIGALDSIAKSAPLLESRLAELTSQRPQGTALPPLIGPDLRQPKSGLERSAEDLLAPRRPQMPADELVEKATAITAMITTVRALHADEVALAHYWGLADELEQQLGEDEVAPLKTRLVGMRHALWDADTAKVVDDAVEGFDKVRDAIDELWPKIPPPTLLPLPHLYPSSATSPLLVESLLLDSAGDRARFLQDAMRAGAYDSDVVAVGGGPPERVDIQPSPPPPPPVTTPPPLTEGAAEQLISSARRTQWLVFLTSIAVAIISGMSALYVGKPWVTPGTTSSPSHGDPSHKQ